MIKRRFKKTNSDLLKQQGSAQFHEKYHFAIFAKEKDHMDILNPDQKAKVKVMRKITSILQQTMHHQNHHHQENVVA